MALFCVAKEPYVTTHRLSCRLVQGEVATCLMCESFQNYLGLREHWLVNVNDLVTDRDFVT